MKWVLTVLLTFFSFNVWAEDVDSVQCADTARNEMVSDTEKDIWGVSVAGNESYLILLIFLVKQSIALKRCKCISVFFITQTFFPFFSKPTFFNNSMHIFLIFKSLVCKKTFFRSDLCKKLVFSYLFMKVTLFIDQFLWCDKVFAQGIVEP